MKDGVRRTIMRVKSPRDGYVRCETLMPVIAVSIGLIPDMPTRRALGLLTEDGPLALGVTAESAQMIADFLAHAQRRCVRRRSSAGVGAVARGGHSDGRMGGGRVQWCARLWAAVRIAGRWRPVAPVGVADQAPHQVRADRSGQAAAEWAPRAHARHASAGNRKSCSPLPVSRRLWRGDAPTIHEVVPACQPRVQLSCPGNNWPNGAPPLGGTARR
jgi:hypothetical protein